MAYVVNYATQLIQITSPQTSVDVQALLNAIREAEAGVEGIQHAQIAEASGKESLGGSVSVGITLELASPWQLSFWAGEYVAEISGGNLVGGLGGDPVAYTAGVQVIVIRSAAATIVSTGGSALTTEEHDQLMAGATSAEMTAIKGAGWTSETLKALYDQVLLRLATTGYTAPDNAGISSLVTRLTEARAGYLDKLNVAGSLAQTGEAMTLTDGAIDGIVADMVTALTASGKTPAQALRLIMAALLGVSGGMADGAPTFADIEGNPAIEGVLDDDGNRTEVTLHE